MKEGKWKPLGKRYNWINNYKSDLIYELLIWDAGRKIDRFVFNSKDKFKEVLELIKLKFGMSYK